MKPFKNAPKPPPGIPPPRSEFPLTPQGLPCCKMLDTLPHGGGGGGLFSSLPDPKDVVVWAPVVS